MAQARRRLAAPKAGVGMISIPFSFTPVGYIRTINISFPAGPGTIGEALLWSYLNCGWTNHVRLADGSCRCGHFVDDDFFDGTR